MKEYLDKIKHFSSHLKSCASWHGSGKSVSNIKSLKTDYGHDYVYEFFCYLTILDDLSKKYDLRYNQGKGNKRHHFPEAPANKAGVPFFYLVNKINKVEEYQVCAGTKIQSMISCERSPDISFQIGNASLIKPSFKEVLMIYDTKRKRPGAKSRKLSKEQYSFFATMIRELGLEKASNMKLKFNQFLNFNGNCLITNNNAHSRIVADNKFHCLKEVESFDHDLDLKKIQVFG